MGFQSFKKIKEERQNKILQAAYKEFTEKSFEDASTNRIASNAGISKGSLFYYFDTKERLFIYLIEKSFMLFNELYINQIDFSESDIFNRLLFFTQVKQENYTPHKAAFDFLGRILLDTAAYIKVYPKIKEKKAELDQLVTNVFSKGIDLNKFRNGLDPQKSIQLIYWAFEGYRTKLESQYDGADFSIMSTEEMEAVAQDFYSYMATLQRAFYKEEYIGGFHETNN